MGPGYVLYDLGCGDGRIVVAAAKKYGIRAVGVDIDPRRVGEAKANARSNHVQQLVEFRLADAKQVDLSEATIVTLYLGPDGTLLLADSLRKRLRPGTRLASCETPIYGWTSDEQETYVSMEGRKIQFFLWHIGEMAGTSVTKGAPCFPTVPLQTATR